MSKKKTAKRKTAHAVASRQAQDQAQDHDPSAKIEDGLAGWRRAAVAR